MDITQLAKLSFVCLDSTKQRKTLAVIAVPSNQPQSRLMLIYGAEKRKFILRQKTAKSEITQKKPKRVLSALITKNFPSE